MDSGTTETLSGIWGTSTGDIFIAGSNGTILKRGEDTPPIPEDDFPWVLFLGRKSN